MANRRRYKDIEQFLTYALIADAVVFVLYLIFAGFGVVAMKVITAILVIAVSVLGLVFLYMAGEMKKRRSRWLVLGFFCIALCLLVSLVLNFPGPAAEAASLAASTGK